MSGSLSLGKIAGTRVEVHASWLLVLALLTASLATDWFPQHVPGVSPSAAWVAGGLVSLLLLASILAHELAHAFLARARGFSVENITLFAFGGISDLEQEPGSAGMEAQLALVGPIINLLVGGIAALLASIVGSQVPLLEATLIGLAFTNIVLALFNLIPGLPLDGGRLLRAGVWKLTGNVGAATYWAALVGQIVAYLLILVGIWQLFGGNLLIGIWAGFIGWFLLQGARVESSQDMAETLFRKIPVGEVMRPVSRSVAPSLSLQELVEVYLFSHGLRAVPVVEDGRFIGLITLSSIRQIPRAQWSQMTVGQAMLPLAQVHVASPAQSVNEVLSLMVRYDINQIPVVQADQIVGMVSRANLLHLLEGSKKPGSTGTPPQPAVDGATTTPEATSPPRAAALVGAAQPHAARRIPTEER